MQIEDDVVKNPQYMAFNEVRRHPIMENRARRQELMQILLQELENLGYEYISLRLFFGAARLLRCWRRSRASRCTTRRS